MRPEGLQERGDLGLIKLWKGDVRKNEDEILLERDS